MEKNKVIVFCKVCNTKREEHVNKATIAIVKAENWIEWNLKEIDEKTLLITAPHEDCERELHGYRQQDLM